MDQAPQGKRSSGQNVVMVDPLEAKRLAVKQMQEIRAREKLKVNYLCLVLPLNHISSKGIKIWA
jgi:hypothetical protein